MCNRWFHLDCVVADIVFPILLPPWFTWEPNPHDPYDVCWQRILRMPVRRGYFDLVPNCPLSFEAVLLRARDWHNAKGRRPEHLQPWLHAQLTTHIRTQQKRNQVMDLWERALEQTNVDRAPFECPDSNCLAYF